MSKPKRLNKPVKLKILELSSADGTSKRGFRMYKESDVIFD